MIHVELTVALVLLIVAAYATAMWLTPYAIAGGRRPAQDMPRFLEAMARRLGVDVYLVDHQLDGYACACFLGTRRAVLVNATFHRLAPRAAVTFVLAHELGHHEFGHPELRLFLTISGLKIFAPMKRLLERTEDQANEWAESVTGIPRAVVWGVGLSTSAAGGTGQSTEEVER